MAVNEPPEETDVEEWANDVYSLIDSTLDVILDHGEPVDAVAVVRGPGGENDVKCVQGELTSADDDDDYMCRIGDTPFDGAGDLDALAVSGLGDGMAEFAEYM